MEGTTFVLAGDFRQMLPIITDVIKTYLKSSPLWQSIETLNLLKNMRAQLNNNHYDNFSHKILKLAITCLTCGPRKQKG